VKNKAHVIRHCLHSVLSLINHWEISDTGSTDGTQDIIQSHVAAALGMLYQRPWQDFEYNRSESLELSSGTTRSSDGHGYLKQACWADLP
jgi:hypothetical protein